MYQTDGARAVASQISSEFTDVLINLAGHTRGNDAVNCFYFLFLECVVKFGGENMFDFEKDRNVTYMSFM